MTISYVGVPRGSTPLPTGNLDPLLISDSVSPYFSLNLLYTERRLKTEIFLIERIFKTEKYLYQNRARLRQ